MDEKLVDRLRNRLSAASHNDRAYERPMTWDEADELLATIAALEAENAKLRGEYICKCGLRVEPHRCADTKGDF